MESRKPLHDEDYEDGGDVESDTTSSSSSSDEYCSSSSESDNEAEVAYLMVDEKEDKDAHIDEMKEDVEMLGSMDQIEELMQPKMEIEVK